jgi:hypothetical protein
MDDAAEGIEPEIVDGDEDQGQSQPLSERSDETDSASKEPPPSES